MVMASFHVLVVEVYVTYLDDIPRGIIHVLLVTAGRHAATQDHGRLITVR